MITLSKKSVVIYVAGQRFSLCTEDSEEYVIQIGEKVDTLIRGVQKDNPRLNRDGCATLVALSLCDDETKLSKKVEDLRLQIKDYLEENQRLTKELESLREKLSENGKETTAEEPEEKKTESENKAPQKSENSHRQTAFVGKNFSKKNKHQKQAKATQNAQPAPYYKKENVEEELPSPLQFSIFDTDFI